MPDMASTFLRQSPTSEVCTWKERKMRLEGLSETRLKDRCCWYLVLFDVLLFHRFKIGPQVHGAFVFGAQKGSHHLIRGYPHLPQCWFFKLASKVLYFQLQLMNLK